MLRDAELLRLDFGVFALHAVLMALWLVVPLSLRKAGLAADHHWQVYLPVLVLSMVLVVPAIIYGEKKAKLKQVFVHSVALLLMSQALLAYTFEFLVGHGDSVAGILCRFQSAGSNAALAHFQDCAGRRQGHGHRRL